MGFMGVMGEYEIGKQFLLLAAAFRVNKMDACAAVPVLAAFADHADLQYRVVCIFCELHAFAADGAVWNAFTAHHDRAGS